MEDLFLLCPMPLALLFGLALELLLELELLLLLLLLLLWPFPVSFAFDDKPLGEASSAFLLLLLLLLGSVDGELSAFASPPVLVVSCCRSLVNFSPCSFGCSLVWPGPESPTGCDTAAAASLDAAGSGCEPETVVFSRSGILLFLQLLLLPLLPSLLDVRFSTGSVEMPPSATGGASG